MHNLLESYFQFIKRSILSRPDDTVIGLEIGASACRAVELARDARAPEGVEVAGWVAQSMDGIDEKTAVMKALEGLGAASRGSPVVAAVSGKGTLIRHIDMPRMTNSDLRKAFILEADKYFPFPKDTVYTDCFIMDPKGRDRKMTVLIAAVKREIVDARLKLLKDCGISPAAVTIGSVAVANAFVAFPPPTCAVGDLAGKAVAVIDIGESSTNLMIMSDGLPRFTRDIFIGSLDVARRFSNITGAPFAQARALCTAKGEADAGHKEDIHKSVEAVVAGLAAEVRLSFDYFMTEKNMPVTRICLVGDGVYAPGAEISFARHFDIPLVMWDPVAALRVRKDRDGLLREARRMVGPLGLALGEYD